MTADQYPKVYLYRRIVQAKLFIDAHYSNRIDLDNIAGEAWFSKFHFIRLFKSSYGKTPHQYLVRVRMNRAMEWLAAGKPVADTCYAVGFESISSFSSLFKKYTGNSPAVFCKLEQDRQQQMAARPLHYIPGCFARQLGWINYSNFE